MTRNTNRQSGKTRTSIAQIEALVKDGGNRANEIRGDGLKGLSLVKRVKLVNTRRERVRLEAKHGVNDPRLQRLDQQMVFERRQMTQMRAEFDRTNAPVAAPSDSAWIFHGYVRTEDGVGLAGYTVALFRDDCGQEEPVVTVLSGKCGYFCYETEPKDGEKILFGGGTRTSKKKGAKVKQTQAFYVGVKDKKGRLLLVESRPVYPRLGAVAYRDIVIPSPDEAGAGQQDRTSSLGLEAINGLGPQRVKKLTQAGIKDISTFIATDNQKLAGILGKLDFKGMKEDARELLKTDI